MIDKDDPLSGGLTPPDYDEYGDGPNPDNTPEQVHDRAPDDEGEDGQESPGESPLG